MTQAILGISAFYHDAAAALVVDGELVAAAQEERFSRKKHDPGFPAQAIAYCLGEAGLRAQDLTAVGFYEKPLLKFDRLLETYLAMAPKGYRSFIKALPLWLNQRVHIPKEIRNGLGGGYQKSVVFCEHHESHGASAFFPSPFEEAAILTMDGVGEWCTSSIAKGEGNSIEIVAEQHFPHSIGLLYSAFTYYTGFRVNSGEYKLMGLAPYGQPIYRDRILEHVIDLKDDGSFHMDQSYFDYCVGETMTSERFHELFEAPPRPPEAPVRQLDLDVAASIQAVTEEIVLRMAGEAHRRTGSPNLCLAGGVALNCVANGRLLREGPFERIWVQPASGDAGGAVGVALLTWHQVLGKPRQPAPSDSQRGSLLGPAFATDDVRAFLNNSQAAFTEFDDDDLVEEVAGLLAEEKVVGWFQGRLEFGPRALGCRSILGDARSPTMQEVMNQKIKFRESFRPFAPTVLAERAHEFFDTVPGLDSPYMVMTASVRDEHRRPISSDERELQGLAQRGVVRSALPATTHVDYSARLQTVDRERHGRYFDLLKRFDEKTGCPVLINTSFNVRGEPIVCTPKDAYRCFMATNMDVLVMDRFVLLKTAQGDAPESSYVNTLEPD